MHLDAGPGVMMTLGTANTLDEAEADLAKNWRKWLTWAGLNELDY